MKPFGQITLVGIGLLGGSIALACRQRQLAKRIVGFGRHADRMEKAVDLKMIDAGYTDLAAAVRDSDLVVLCTPVGSLVPRARELMPLVKAGCLITDVGSVKGALVNEIEALTPEGVYFVGSHPIAGGEQSGFEAAQPGLFENARCIVTPTERTDDRACQRIREFWEALGMRVSVLDADEHDRIYAAVSHLPHVVAYTLVNTVGRVRTHNCGDVLAMSAGGLRDITRIASSDPVLWRDICLYNRKHVLDMIDSFQQALETVKSLIAEDQADSLEKLFAEANEYRARLAEVLE